MKECTTHHYCDCVGEKIKRLEAKLERAMKVVEAARVVVMKYSLLPDNTPALGVMYLEQTLAELKELTDEAAG